jgi:hypothetical protein
MPSVSDPQEAPSRTSSYVLHFLPTIPQDFKNAFECIIGQCIVHPRWHHSRASSQVYGDFYICCEDVLVKIWRGKLPDLLRPRSLHACRRRQRRSHHRDETAINAQRFRGTPEPCPTCCAFSGGGLSPLCDSRSRGKTLSSPASSRRSTSAVFPSPSRSRIPIVTSQDYSFSSSHFLFFISLPP